MSAVRSPQEREAAHEAKVMEVIRTRFREVRRSKTTGKLIVEINLNKGGPTGTYTEIDVKYRVLEE